MPRRRSFVRIARRSRALWAVAWTLGVVALTLGVIAPGLTAGSVRAAPSPADMDAAPQVIDGRLVLPAWETSWERRWLRQKDSQNQLDTFRQNHPELYGVTEAPLQPVRHYAETDPVDAVYMVWEPGMFDGFYGELTGAILTHTTVTLYLLHHGQDERASIEALMLAGGDDPEDASFIDMAELGPYYTWRTEWPFDRSLESFWAVDFGPFFVTDAEGTLGIMDPRYYPWRVNDDAVPTKLGALHGLTVWRPDLDWEGGNLFSDGQGSCFTTQMHLAENLPQTQAEVENQLFAYFGCEQVFWLHTLHGEGTGHIDMFFKPASPTVLLVGEYDATDDPINAARLDWNATILAEATNVAGDPFDIRRFPMPRHGNDVWRTYANGIVINDLVLMPTYAEDRTHEADALAVFADAFPGRTLMTIDSDDIIEWGGSIHCVTRTRPQATGEPITPAPEPRCDGAFRCTTGCGDLDFTGDCLDGLVIYCDGGEVIVESCYFYERCGWDLRENEVYCVTAGCQGLPAEGECRTSAEGVVAAVTCVGGYPHAERCAPEVPCGIQPETGLVGCGPLCEDECAAGEGGCEDDDHRWFCESGSDPFSCLERVAVACPEQTLCEDATCVPLPTKEPRKGCGCMAPQNEDPSALLFLLVMATFAWRRRRAARKEIRP